MGVGENTSRNKEFGLKQLEKDSRKMRNCKRSSKLHILLSGFVKNSTFEKEIIWKIKKLGGYIYDIQEFGPQCTHLVCAKPSRSEKYLSACAMGKYVVTPEFVEISFIRRAWEDAKKYEWNEKMVDTSSDIPLSVYSAPSRCMSKVAAHGGTGMFHDWTVLIHLEDQKRAAVFRRILRAGGANVINYRLPIKDKIGIPHMTHVFTVQKFVNDVKILKDMGIPCISTDYIRNFLLLDPAPDIKVFSVDFYVPNCQFYTVDKCPPKPELDSDTSVAEAENKLCTKVGKNMSRKRKSNDSLNTSPSKPEINVFNNVPRTVSPLSSQNSTDGDKKLSKHCGPIVRYSPKKCSKKQLEMYNSLKSTPDGKHQRTLDWFVKSKSDNFSTKKTNFNVGIFDKLALKTSVCIEPYIELAAKKPHIKSEPNLLQIPERKACTQTLKRPQKSAENMSDDSDIEVLFMHESIMKKKNGSEIIQSPSKSLVQQIIKGYEMPNKDRLITLESPRKLHIDTFSSTSLQSPSKIKKKRRALFNQNSPKKGNQLTLIECSAQQLKTKVEGNELSLLPSLGELCSSSAVIKKESGSEIILSPPKMLAQQILKGCEIPNKDGLITLEPLGKLHINELSSTSPQLSSKMTTKRQSLFNQKPPKKGNQTLIECSSKQLKTKVEGKDLNLLPRLGELCSYSAVADKEPSEVQLTQCCQKDSRGSSIEPCFSDEKDARKKLRISLCRLEKEVISSTSSNSILTVEETSSQSNTPLPTISSQVLRKVNSHSSPSSSGCYESSQMKILDSKPTIFPLENNKAFEMCASILAIFEACVEEQYYVRAVDYIASILSSKQYPPAQNLNAIMFDILLTSVDEEVSWKAYSLLCKVLILHPPKTQLMKQYYFNVINYHVRDSDSPFNVLYNLMCQCIRDISSNADEANYMPPSFLLLKFIFDALLCDFAFHESKDQMIIQNQIPIIAKIIWYNSSPGHMNNHFRKFLYVYVQCIVACESIKSQNLFFKILFKFNKIMCAICKFCQLTPSDDDEMKHGTTIARELASMLNTHVEDALLLKLALNNMHPSWLVVAVTEFLAESYQNPFCSPSEKSLSMQKIVNYYMYIIPNMKEESSISPKKGNNPNNSLNQSFHQKEINLTIKRQSFPKHSSQRVRNINKKNGRGETQLHIACMKNKIETVKELLTVPGIDVNIQDNAGWSPLHEACNHGHAEIVLELVKFKPKQSISGYFKNGKNYLDLTIKGESGITPLHDAVMNDMVKCCYILLHFGGKSLLDLKTNDGQRPIDVVQSTEMKELLTRAYNCDPTIESPGVTLPQKFISNDMNFEDISGGGDTTVKSSDYDELLKTWKK
ncbi:SMC5-SMC6 complex localization factor protein 1 [Nymphon striatum]|nr:SMC5-SMC6 complex localization factor protein 1 [Nymphon striatum]